MNTEVQIIERIKRFAGEKYIIPGSTPVISFGDFTQAKISTLSLNPSSAEFLNTRKGTLLPRAEKRFVDFETLGLDFTQRLNDEHAQIVWQGCKDYFKDNSNPYLNWFGHLEKLLSLNGASYFDGSATHMDIVQWATNPVWGELEASDRKHLLENDLEFFKWQFMQPNIKVHLLNGAEVIDHLASNLPFKLADAGTLGVGNRINGFSVKLVKSSDQSGKLILGWRRNVQYRYMTSALRSEYIDRLGEWIKEEMLETN